MTFFFFSLSFHNRPSGRAKKSQVWWKHPSCRCTHKTHQPRNPDTGGTARFAFCPLPSEPSPRHPLPPARSLSHLFPWLIGGPLFPNRGLTYVYFSTLLLPQGLLSHANGTLCKSRAPPSASDGPHFPLITCFRGSGTCSRRYNFIFVNKYNIIVPRGSHDRGVCPLLPPCELAAGSPSLQQARRGSKEGGGSGGAPAEWHMRSCHPPALVCSLSVCLGLNCVPTSPTKRKDTMKS